MERYRLHRYPTVHPVMLDALGRKIRMDIVDVNQSGARLRGPVSVTKGTPLTVPILNQKANATVSWVGADYIGIRFQPPLSSSQVDVLRKGVRSMTPTRFSSIGLPEMR